MTATCCKATCLDFDLPTMICYSSVVVTILAKITWDTKVEFTRVTLRLTVASPKSIMSWGKGGLK